MLKKLRCTMDLSGQFFLIKKAEDNNARRKYHNYIRCNSGNSGWDNIDNLHCLSSERSVLTQKGVEA